MENRRFVPAEETGKPNLHIVEEPVKEKAYVPGGMSTLIGEAMLGRGGKVRLSPADLQNPDRIGLIHYELRDQLRSGNSIDIRSTGHQDIIVPEPIHLYKNDE